MLEIAQHGTFGGPHNQLLRLSGPLRAHGWQIVAVLPEGPGNARERLLEAGIKVIQVPLHRPRRSLDPRLHFRLAWDFLPEIRNLRRIIKEEQADLVQVIGTMYPHGAIAARLERIPVVWQLLSTFAPFPVRCAMMPAILGLSNVVMTTGRGVANAHPGTSLLGKRLVPFFPPVDTNEFRPDSARGIKAREEFQVPKGALLVGTVGNFNRQKGHDILVHAASQVCQELPGAYFRILGEETRSQASFYNEKVMAAANQLGLLKDGRLKFIEPGSRIAELLPAFDLFVMTSRAEGVPTSILEAMACGLPVVATRVGAVGEVVEEGETGCLIPPHNSRAAARAILALLRNSQARWRYGIRARLAAVERYDTTACVQTHLHAYELALARKSASKECNPSAAASLLTREEP